MSLQLPLLLLLQGGNIWSLTSAPSALWISIVSDSSGTYLAAAIQGGDENGGIYTSSSG